MARTAALDNLAPRHERAVERAETRALICRAGAQTMVLLSNNGVLPLAPGLRLALIGPNALYGADHGRRLRPAQCSPAVSPWEGLANALGEDALSFAKGCDNHRFRPALPGPFRVEWYASPDLSGPLVHVSEIEEFGDLSDGRVGWGPDDPDSPYSLRITGRFTPELSGLHEVGVHAAGRARVKIDGVEVVEAWESWTLGTTFFEQGCEERLGQIMLEAGRPVKVSVEFRSARQRGLGLQGFHAGIGRPAGEAEILEAAASPPTRTWRCCSLVAPPSGTARALTCPICGCPARRMSWSGAWRRSPNARWSSYRPAGRWRWTGLAMSMRSSKLGIPARRRAMRSQTCSPAAPSRAGGSRNPSP